jgi:hypothetical protein
LLWDNNDEITFVEKTYKEGQADKIVEYKFTVEA